MNDDKDAFDLWWAWVVKPLDSTFITVALFSGIGLLLSLSVVILDQYISRGMALS